MGGSHYTTISNATNASIPSVDLALAPRIAGAVHQAIAKGLIASAHDISDGGTLTAIAEMLIASQGLGATLELERVESDLVAAAFGEAPTRYVLEIAPGHLPAVQAILKNLPHTQVGVITSTSRLEWKAGDVDMTVEKLADAWLAPLNW
jgi:phosphoribosylformylglycinamidine synthase